MIRSRLVAALSLLALSACNPALNWRDVAMPQVGVKALLPCKPDRGHKPAVLAGEAVEIEMAGCEAQGHLFALSCLGVKDANHLLAVQQAWQSAMLANMQASGVQTQGFVLKGSSAWPAPVGLVAQGRNPQGEVVQARAAWFAKGAALCHAVVYAPRMAEQAADAFFSGIEIQ